MTGGTERPEDEIGSSQDPGAFGIGRLFWLTSDAIVGADVATGSIVLWNPAAAELFGYAAEEALGMLLERLVPAELKQSHLSGISRYRGGGDPVLVGGRPVDVPAVTKSGETVEIALTLTDVGVEQSDRGRRQVLALIRDMTAVRASERELNQAMDAMREFVATASHDLRSPLTSVMGFSGTMLDMEDRLTPEKRREFLQAIHRGATQASRLVDDLLTLSQIQAGAVPAHVQEVVVADVIREAIARTGDVARAVVSDELVVRVDSDHLERILVNYLMNASRYGEPPIVVTAELQHGLVDIGVHDCGAGVPAEFIPRLFTRFARADTSRRDGTGLGLSIVQGLARANGGEAYYDADGEGPCFGVRLAHARA